MAIQTSDNYELDVKTRRLFGRMHNELVDLNKAIENMLTATHTMRTALGAATFTLAEVEYIHVNMQHDRRANDAILFEAQTRLSEMLDAAKANAKAAGDVVSAQAPKVAALSAQAIRIGNKDIVDVEPTGPKPGMDYVEIGYFAAELECSTTHIRSLVNAGAITEHDAVEEGKTGRPKYLWLKHKAAAAIEGLRARGAGAGAFN